MKAARCEAYGGPEGIVLRTVDDPAVTPGHVLVDVAAAAINFPDLLIMADRYQLSAELPFTPGSEFAGRVAAVGDGVEGFAVGDRVNGSVLHGAMAEKVLVHASSVTAVPDELSMAEAASFRVTYLTAYHALVTAGGVAPGEWVVVLGAAGGVGSAAVDIAVALGARVIAVDSPADRLEVCRTRGAHEVIDYRTDDLKARIREIAGGGAHVVVDPVGGASAEPALRGLRWGGRYVTLGYAGGEIPRIPLNLVLLKNITLRGVDLRAWGQALPEVTREARQGLAELFAAGMRPHVSEVHSFDQVRDALQRVADRKVTGKVVIRIADEEEAS